MPIWILWGPVNTGDSVFNNPGNILARKTGVAGLITEYKPIGNHFINSVTAANSISFLDATQGFSSTGSQLQVFGRTDGYEITVPADTTTRALQVYAGTVSARGKITAFLSDGSAPVVTDVSFDDPNGSDFSGFGATSAYSITFSAASAGQTLTVRYTMDFDYGNGQISLMGAALNGSPVAPVAPNPQITGISPGTAPTNTKVTIAGSNFGATQAQGGVYFGGVTAQIVNWSDTSIDVIVPAALTDGSTVSLAILNGFGTSNSVVFATPSFKVVPTAVNLVVGQAKTLEAADDQGNSILGLSWSSDDPTVVSLSTDDPPIAVALSPGSTRIIAGDAVVPVNVYATAIPLVSLSIVPQSSHLPLGLSQQLRATGTYADGSSHDITSAVTWNSLLPSIASINPSGLARGVQVGSATIQASLSGVTSSATFIVTPVALSSVNITPAIPATSVGGTQQFNATGVYTDGTSQDLTASVTWSSSVTSVATINATGLATGTSSGRTLISVTQGNITNLVTLVVASGPTPPSIVAVPSSDPVNGWINMNGTVSYVCTPGSAAIVSCSGPHQISADGVGQTFSGTVVDAAGNSASTSITLNVDKTRPALTVTSPSDTAVLTDSNLVVTGTSSDELSGIDTVTCNGLPATVTGTNFSCNVTLSPGLNLLVVRATDLAGNVAVSIMHVQLNVPLPPPASLQVTPVISNLLVGETRELAVVDEFGRVRADATWSVSDTSVGNISADSQLTFTALTPGQVTVTANVGPISSQATVNILLGTVLPVGTSRWEIPPAPGFSAHAVVPAQLVDGGPDLYSVEGDSSGNFNIRALTAEGRQMWSSKVQSSPSSVVVAAGDASGGLLLTTSAPGARSEVLTDLDPQTGSPLWSLVHTGLTTFNPTQPAIADDGTLYFWRQEGSLGFPDHPPKVYLAAVDGLTGIPIARYPVPLGTDTSSDGRAVANSVPIVTDPLIDSDGTVWALFTVITTTPQSLSEDLSLLRVSAGGGSSTMTFKTIQGDPIHGPIGSPWQMIPNGQGGALVSWQAQTFSPSGTPTFYVSNISPNGSSADFTFESWMNKLVLSDKGVAFADSFTGVRAFDINTGTPLWNHSAVFPNVVAATSEGGVIVNEANQGLVTLDASGRPAASMGTTVLIAAPMFNSWAGVLNTSLSLFRGPDIGFSASSWVNTFGNAQNQHKPPFVIHVKLHTFKVGSPTGVLHVEDWIPAAREYWSKETRGIISLEWNKIVDVVTPCVIHPDCLPIDDEYLQALNINTDAGSILRKINFCLQKFPDRTGLNVVQIDTVFNANVRGVTLGTVISVQPPRAGPPSNIILLPTNTADEFALKHEIGHGFSLRHVPDPLNLMCAVPNGNILLQFLPYCTETFSTNLTLHQIVDVVRTAIKLGRKESQ